MPGPELRELSLAFKQWLQTANFILRDRIKVFDRLNQLSQMHFVFFFSRISGPHGDKEIGLGRKNNLLLSQFQGFNKTLSQFR